MSVAETPAEQRTRVETITWILRNRESFNYQFPTIDNTLREVTVRVMWDEDAEELVQHFRRLVHIWRRLDFRAPLLHLKKLLQTLIKTVQQRKSQGPTAAQGYVISDTITNGELSNTIYIPISAQGIPSLSKTRASQNDLKTGETTELPLDIDTINMCLNKIFQDITIVSRAASNTLPLTDTETLLSELLEIVETRLAILKVDMKKETN